jgi:hypothetical protein
VEVIVKLPTFGDGAINKALEREIRTGFELIKQNEKREELRAAEEAKLHGSKTVPGIGKCVGLIPADEYFRLCKKYGRKEVHSKDFMRYFNRKFPHLSPNKA